MSGTNSKQCQAMSLSMFFVRPHSLLDFCGILTMKLFLTNIISKMIFLGGKGGTSVDQYQFECSILNLYCYLAKFQLTAVLFCNDFVK